MRIFHGFESLPRFVHPAVTVGSYDGIHCGHRALLEKLAAAAAAAEGESVLLTFEPHPRITLGRAEGLKLLTTFEEKCLLLERSGVDNTIVIPFDKAFSRISPSEFLHRYLIGKVGAETMIAGYNHRFGHCDNGENRAFPEGRKSPMKVVEVAECDVDGWKVSSTVVRELVAQGKMQRAARLLGHPYLVIGEVASGLVLTDPMKMLPPQGTYAILTDAGPATVRIDGSGRLRIHPDLPDGKIQFIFRPC